MDCYTKKESIPNSNEKVILHITGVTLPHGGKNVAVQFSEKECVKRINKRRALSGEISPNFFCFQLRETTTVYRDIDDSPVKIKVKRKTGCELRCVDKGCGTNAAMK